MRILILSFSTFFKDIIYFFISSKSFFKKNTNKTLVTYKNLDNYCFNKI